MIPKECKLLAEVDFPIAMVGKHALAEKARRMGTPHQLHLWWARRPLAACRAVLLALLWPDPCDPNCPEEFRRAARRSLPSVQGDIGAADLELRHALLEFIGNFANWNLSSTAKYLEVSRDLVRAAHGTEPPLVVDPFAGGGSIRLEALRLGCEAFASDLNPVACLILKIILEDIPRHGLELTQELQRVGVEVRVKAEKELARYYPQDSNGDKPIAYLWARTVRCESPNCGAEVPLVRSFWLCKKANRKRALKHRVVRHRNETPRIEFEIFEPQTERDVQPGTVTRAKATCLACTSVLTTERVRALLAAQSGGADVIFDKSGSRVGGAFLLAIATLSDALTGRHYRLPCESDYRAVWLAQQQLAKISGEWENGDRGEVSPVPDEEIPLTEIRRISVPLYGMRRWGNLFTAREKLSLSFLAENVSKSAKGPVSQLLAMICTKLADRCNSLVNWSLGVECPNQLFKGNSAPMAWDFAESNVLAGSSASILQTTDNIVANARATFIPGVRTGTVQRADAAEHPLPDETAAIWFTDPPYYDAVPYAHLADFFFVWLKRTLATHPLICGLSATPKEREIVVDRPHRLSTSVKNAAFYEGGMAKAFAEGRRELRDDGIGCVVFAHKTTEGWESLLSGLIRGGWTITASWPVATERSSRVTARDTASLATSVHLICRPRTANEVGDWSEVLRELPKRVGDWMERLQLEGVRGADLVFACIGPALEIFSRYGRVETAEGREVKLAEYLEKVWEVVGRTALEQVLGTAEARARNGAAGALEEDARLTALFLWTLQSTNGAATESAADEEDMSDEDDEDESASRGSSKGYSLVFDVVRRFAQPLGIGLPKWDGRIIETKKGVVRLLPVTERSRQLFGEDGTQLIAERLERSRGKETLQLKLFGAAPDGDMPQHRSRARRRVPISDSLDDHPDATTLDRVHMAMLLQANGRTNALRMLLKAEQERGPDFLRLANALSALYPRTSEEKRLLDAMLLAVPR